MDKISNAYKDAIGELKSCGLEITSSELKIEGDHSEISINAVGAHRPENVATAFRIASSALNTAGMDVTGTIKQEGKKCVVSLFAVQGE
jgi:hypothetical protein